ncbi:ImmA/IrrE family metallo-endopeptidase [Mangrovibacterium diazotrophicum]|uniref:Zn-dependent peptidase ImmA (M78 family) n=1 Tax=Mangrovibacterium diazotrophicum TaxID=1261403 RepID=A0A419WAT4_9BACT|nr:ImmA/IrrE family metallo-endopeptidase [Mangrovibacterium diazotrophicum]RKD92526.1 Zn-dependent peptidase ImmA (M78 family) [Mangrovibacterium diazotrophicum]
MIKIKDIERKAQEILLQLKINKAPVPIEEVVVSLGLVIDKGIFGDTISGFLLTKENVNLIAVKSTESEVRQRFTIAHELGHFLFHSTNKDDIFISNVLFRNESSSTGEIRMEREANSFAAAILMPAKFINDEIQNLNNKLTVEEAIKDLADVFKVSEVAMTYRLTNLGYNI